MDGRFVAEFADAVAGGFDELVDGFPAKNAHRFG